MQEPRILERFAGHYMKYLPSKLLPALTGFISLPILTRLFTPTEYGNWALVTGISDLLFAFAISGLGSIPVRHLPAYEARSELRTFFATLGVCIGGVVLAVGALSFVALLLMEANLDPNLYHLLLVSILIFMAQSIFAACLEIVRSQERSSLFTAFELINRYGSLGLGLFLVVVFGLRIEGLLWGTTLILALAILPLLLLTTRGISIHLRDFRWADARRMLRYAAPLSVGNFAMWGLRLSDRYIIGHFWSSREVGLYSVAYNLSDKSINMLVMVFVLSMFPVVMNTWERNGRRACEDAMRMITRVYTLVCLPAVVGISLLAHPLLSLFTTGPFVEGYRVVPYVAGSAFLYGLWLFAIVGSLVGQETGRIAIGQIAAALISIGLNLTLIPTFGFVAAGGTSVLGFVFLLLIQTSFSRRHITWRFPLRSLRNSSIAVLCMGLAVWATRLLLAGSTTQPVLLLVVSVLGGIPVYLICVILLGEADERERTVMKRAFDSLVRHARLGLER